MHTVEERRFERRVSDLKMPGFSPRATLLVF